jgi:putative spermidine/putrescine transport system ATP-binding protein
MDLRVSGIEFAYGKGPNVLDGLSFEVGQGQIAALLGRSGSGKTTVLNVIAGFLVPSEGSVSVEGRDIVALPPGRRDMGMVMQDLSLFPNMTALENVEYGLRARGMKKASARDRATSMLDRMEMASLKDRSVRALSGGERQRVALARSLVYDPKVLLMDEPLSSLDPSLRDALRKDVRMILKDQGVTTLYVTHDRAEALSIADRIHILDGGRIIESGDPRDIYRRPRTLKGAMMMGIMTPIPITSRVEDRVQTPFGRVMVKGVSGSPVRLGYRPEEVHWSDPGDALRIGGMVVRCDFRGRDHDVDIDTGRGIFSASSSDPIATGRRAAFFVRRADLFALE